MKKLYLVVMLPTEKASKLYYNEPCEELKYDDKCTGIRGANIYYNLFVLSSETIQKGDWCIDIVDNILFQVKEQGHSGLLRSDTDTFVEDACKKVIATTDKSLKLPTFNDKFKSVSFGGKKIEFSLPQIPESFLPIFVKAYNEANVGGVSVTSLEVELEYENEGVIKRESDYFNYDNGHKLNVNFGKLKTTESNEVIISLPDFEINVKNPMDKAALITVKDGVELYREVGFGGNRKRIYPNEEIIKIQKELIEVLEYQVESLCMMSKIELGDDVIEKIKSLREKLK